MNTCESTSNQPPTPTGQTHRKKYTTSKAYQSHGGRIVTGKIFILTGAIINIDYKKTTLQSGIHQTMERTAEKVSASYCKCWTGCSKEGLYLDSVEILLTLWHEAPIYCKSITLPPEYINSCVLWQQDSKIKILP